MLGFSIDALLKGYNEARKTTNKKADFKKSAWRLIK
jgi:hypothetical protein